jgi:hypothetical protein
VLNFIERSLARDLGATVETAFNRDSFSCRIDLLAEELEARVRAFPAKSRRAKALILTRPRASNSPFAQAAAQLIEANCIGRNKGGARR